MLLFEVQFSEIQGMAIVLLFGLTVYLMTELRGLKREIRSRGPATPGNSMLALQAYERLTLLADRMALKNLVARMHSPELNATELQTGLLENIRSEYEHNITQQIYINPEVWKAVSKMKEQNIFIINQLAATLPLRSTAIDLSKLILEYSSNSNAELSPLVLDAIQYEVKKLI